MNLYKPAGREYLEYQKEGIEFLLKRKGAILADDMGLGKTVQCLGVCNNTAPNRVLVICPASVKGQWKEEAEEWIYPHRPFIAYSDNFEVSELTIINFDILDKNRNAIRSIEWDLIVIDEAHMIKNSDTKRFQSIFAENGVKTKRIILSTGTPIENRPKELWNLLSLIGATDLFGGNYYRYAAKYCGGHWKEFWKKGKNGKPYQKRVYDDSGATNLDELREKLKPVMIRRKKADVLPDLPPKTRQTFFLESKKVSHGGIENAINMKFDDDVLFQEIAKLRKEIGIRKIPFVVDHVQAYRPEGKALVFCWHTTEIAPQLVDGFRKKKRRVFVITGKDSPEKKDQIRKEFNRSRNAILVGGIKSAGTGLNLQSCDYGVFAELPFTPSYLDQAEDRLWRYGQKKPVLIHYLLMDRSIDIFMGKILLHKKEVIKEALDWVPIIKKSIGRF